MPTTPQPVGQDAALDQTFLNDVIRGLSKPRKELNCKYLYDEEGSRLFDRICRLDDYYLTRTELAIMEEHARDMVEQLGQNLALVEFGSGSSVKTRALLDHVQGSMAYMPLDISEEHLMKTASELREVYPELEVVPIVADFTKGFELPETQTDYAHAAVYFPGSTIGNFTPAQAGRMMQRIGTILGDEGGLLIGIDLQKDPAVIEAAYNDPEGITEEFILNLLHRINRELDGDIDVEKFRHKAVFNRELGRVEISVVSQEDETFRIDDREFAVRKGEEILTEYSHKYTLDGFVALAGESGFTLCKHWVDEQDYFAVLHMVNRRDHPALSA